MRSRAGFENGPYRARAMTIVVAGTKPRRPDNGEMRGNLFDEADSMA
jgi:hypothetical protein